MARVTPPYFFNEFLQPVRRKQPTEREQALGLTLNDLDWLHTLYYATDQARQNTELRKYPMQVEKLQVSMKDQPALPLAGAFIMSPSPDGQKALLYTPYGGIEVFDSRDELLSELNKRINTPSQNTDLIIFLSIYQRAKFTPDQPCTLTSSIIDGAVMQDQEQTLQACQHQNAQDMLAQLRTTPTLSWMLDTLLGIMARSYFSGLDQRDTRVNTRHQDASQWASSVPLSEVLLQFYLKQAWPGSQTRKFTNPRHDTRAFTAAQLAADQRQWESLIEQTAGILSKLLSSLLLTWWHEDIGGGRSRLGLFAQVMSDKFRVDLLLKRQNGILSAEESHQLLATFLPDQAARSAWHAHLNIDKVKIHAPYQHYVELAATLLINDTHAYLYTQSRGLQVLKDLADLNDTLLEMLKAAGHQDELLNFLSLDERSVYIGMDQVQISGVPVLADVFGEMVQDIAAKQLSNLEHALAVYRRSEGAVDLAALLDCALDLRHMLDSRLLALDTQGRWSTHPVSSDNGRPSTVQAERAKQQLLTLRAADAALAMRRREHPTLRTLAAQALDKELNERSLALHADDVYVNTYATEARQEEDRKPLTSVSMVDHFIQRLSHAAPPVEETPQLGFYGKHRAGFSSRWNSLNGKTFNAVIEHTLAPFSNHDIRMLPRLFLRSHRDALNDALMLGLRSEAELRLLNKTLSPASQAIVDTVLRPDSMTRVKRHGLKGFLPDAFGLTLKVGTDERAHALANCFVLTERGGLDPDHSGQAVLWTPQLGHETFVSVQALRDSLAVRLSTADDRLMLLDNLPIGLRWPHQTFQLGPLQRIDEHLLDNRQQSYLDYSLNAIDYWLAAPLGPRQLQDCLDNQMLRAAPSNLGRATDIARAMVLQQALPVWLGMASAQEQLRHAELLEQYRLSAADDRDYLHALPPLRDHVASALRALLNARFDGFELDPDDILIPTRVMLNGHSQSLTDFAQRHLPNLLADTLKPFSRTRTPLPPTLDGAALVQLIRQLDIAKTYRALLDTHLSADTEDARKRKALFCQQLPWQLLSHAHEEILEERLSATAWSFVQQVFDMPDAIARASVSGVTAMIRPLELVATPGATPARARGIYLIGPHTGASGPQVLYAPYCPTQTLTEFPREEDLLEQLNRPGPLQDWVIRQLDDPQRATYRHLMQAHPRSPSSDLGLASSPVRGNLLPLLFDDNTQQLARMLGSQFDPNGKSAWDAVTSLFGKGIPMALQFISGKLQYPLAVWRSYKLFKASAESLQNQRWAEGMRPFIQGVATLASLRSRLDQPFKPRHPPASPTPEMPDEAGPGAATTLATLDITDPLRTRLRHFENVDISLIDLQRRAPQQPYSHPVSKRTYVPVAGKVYPVTKAGARWRIVLDEEIGPYVERNARGEWVFDLSQHHPRLGPTLSRYIGRRHTRSAERDAINIEAVGLPAITALSPWKAQCINEGLNVATYYAVTCKRNIVQFATDRKPGSRVGLFLTEMFGVLSFSPSQLQKIEQRVDEILDALVDPTLTNLDSGRFVTGTARWSPQDTYAFTLPDDVQKKIYLLDRFFDPHMDVYENLLKTPFNISAHARAAIITHEISHFKCNTEDLAYLDSMRPFHDLINVGTLRGQLLYTDLSDLRTTALSTLTPASLLFKTWDSLSQRWEDLGRFGGVHGRDRVFKLTGAKTLDDARQIFMSDADKRIDTILANADSLTYLISHLGRELDQGA